VAASADTLNSALQAYGVAGEGRAAKLHRNNALLTT